jgi:TetR/AcrR family transcriptional regulator, cholesterol catabolism regulator
VRKAQERIDAMAVTPHRASRANRKDEILGTFAELVAERGYDEVSLRDIAERLDMSKGTILHHFGSKDRMLERLHADYMTRRLAEAEAILTKLHSPTARLSAIVHQLMVAEGDDRSSTVAFAREIMRFASEETMRDVRGMRARYTRLLRDIVRQGMEEGTFVVGNPDIVTLQIFGMCNWSWTWYRPGGRWTAEEIAGTFVQTLLGGLERGERSQATEDELAEVPRLVRETMDELASE